MAGIQQIRNVLSSIYGEQLRLNPEPKAAIDEAEARLGQPLPKLLREYYELTGYTDRVNAVHDRLVGPAELDIRQGALVFYVENQGVTYWGIREQDLEQPDPPVYRAWNEAALNWELECRTLSTFLVSMAYSQAVEGLPNAALGWADPQVASQIAERWPELHRSDVENWLVFGSPGVVLCLFGDDAGGQLQVGTREAEVLRNITAELNVEWDLIETADDEETTDE